MRTKNSIYNSISSLISSSTAMIIGFVAQALFIRLLGIEYLGLNGLFTNVLTMLSLFELGVGNAIVYHLYKPIADGNETEVKVLMNFYKKAYNFIAFTVLVIGLIIVPFIPNIVGKVSVDINIYAVYLLFLISTISTYLVAYKRSLIYANQKNYLINFIHTAYLVIMNSIQLTLVFLTKNYYLYLGSKVFCQVAENIVISIICNKLYPFIKEKNTNKIDKKTEKDIFNKVKALLFHKVGAVLVNGTDNIIISKFLGVYTVGLYANYEMITKSCTNMFGQIISSTTASVGNLLTTGDTKKSFEIFKKIRFINFWVSAFTATCIFVIAQPFIKLWVGKECLLSIIILGVIVFNYFQKMQRSSYSTFKDSAGIWEEDKFVPLIEAVINIVVSIVMVKLIGLAGVFIGTIVSGLSLWCYSYPRFVYKKLFNRSYLDYAKETLGYILLFVSIAALTFYISSFIVLNNELLQVVVNTSLCLVIPNIIIILLFRKSDEFKYMIDIFKKMFKKLHLIK